MAESVLTNTNANFQAFQQATTYAQQRAQAAENARASIAALIPDAQAAANAKADALIAAGAKADALAAAGAKTNAVAAAALLPDLRAARLAATAAAGLIPHSGGDHTTIPAGAGVYRIMTDAEAGQVWERVAGGGVLRRPELEAAAATDVQETRALAQQADTKAGSASTALSKLETGLTVGAREATGPTGAPEQPPAMIEISDTLKVYRKTNGIAERGAVASIVANSPGGIPRTQVLGIEAASGLSWYPDRDAVSLFVEANLPAPDWTGACTFTANSVTVPGGVDLSAVTPGMIVDTNHVPHRYSGFVVSVAGQTITVEGWYLVNPAVYTPAAPAPKTTPPNGAGVWINPISRAWAVNANLLVPAGVPAPSGVICEYGVVNNSEFSVNLNGVDVVSLGRYGPAASYLARGGTALPGGRAEAHYVALGADKENFKSANGTAGPPTTGFADYSTSYVGFLSQGAKTGFHALYRNSADPNSTVFFVNNDGLTRARVLGIIDGTTVQSLQLTCPPNTDTVFSGLGPVYGTVTLVDVGNGDTAHALVNPITNQTAVMASLPAARFLVTDPGESTSAYQVWCAGGSVVIRNRYTTQRVVRITSVSAM